MPFYIAYANADGTRNVATEFMLRPAPSRVVYPVDPTGSRVPTVGGTTIVQQPSVDNRIREWIWEGYPGWMADYQALWAAIEPLRSRYRKMASSSNSPYVYLRETETGLLRTISVSGTTVTSTSGWLKCRVLEASREIKSDAALTMYQITKLAFTVDDPAFNDLG